MAESYTTLRCAFGCFGRIVGNSETILPNDDPNLASKFPQNGILRNFDFEVAEKLTSRGAIATCLLLVQACKLIIVVSRT